MKTIALVLTTGTRTGPHSCDSWAEATVHDDGSIERTGRIAFERGANGEFLWLDPPPPWGPRAERVSLGWP
jgi:hypothetical protein